MLPLSISSSMWLMSHSRRQTTSSHAQTQVAPFVYGDRVQLGCCSRQAGEPRAEEISCAVDHHEYCTAALLGSWASGLFSRIRTHVQAALGYRTISVDRRGSSLPSPKVDRSLLSRLADDASYRARTHAGHVAELSPLRDPPHREDRRR